MKSIKKINSSSRKGDFAEYYAVTWLWDNGYEVFQNSGCSGPVDMIAMKDNNVILIDVKTFCKQSDKNERLDTSKWGTRTQKQKEMGVKVLGFDPDTRDLRFVDHKEV